MSTAASSPAYNVIWQPQPGPQSSLLACPTFEVFFGGARGGGKTDGMLGEWISHAELYGARAIGLMVRRERMQLIETIERSRQLFTPLGARFNEREWMWRFRSGARLRFAYLEQDSDADAYQGHSYTRIYVEEIGTFPSARPVMKLMATLRSGAGVPVGFRATGNPGGPGHQWVKARYIDPAPLGWKVVQEAFRNPWTGQAFTRDRIFIPSRVTDNRYLGADYVANLQMSGNERLVRAWLEGDWSVVEGAFFPEWSTARHVVRPFAIPRDWLRFRSGDWGSASPFSFGWWAVAGDTVAIGEGGELMPAEAAAAQAAAIIPRGALVRYREWYGAAAPNIGLKLPAEDVADRIRALEQGDGRITYGVLDPAAFASDGGPSIAERMARRGVHFRRADNARVAQRAHARMYMLVFHCRAVGGELTHHPLECSDVGWFVEDALPAATAGAHYWGPMAFAALRGEDRGTHFDPVRTPIWREEPRNPVRGGGARLPRPTHRHRRRPARRPRRSRRHCHLRRRRASTRAA